MSSEFVIGWPQVWRNGTIDAAQTTSPVNDWLKTSGGSSQEFWQDATPQGACAVGVNAGSAMQIDCVFWKGGRYLLEVTGGSVLFRATGTNTPWSSLESKSITINTVEDLYGVDKDIVVHDFRASPLSTAYQYYIFLSGAWASIQNGKVTHLYPCEAFDFGRDPDVSSEIELSHENGTWRQFLVGNLIFSGVSDSKVAEFNSKILQYRDVNPVFFYDSSDVFGFNKAAFVWIEDCQRQMVYRDNNRLTIRFREAL